MQQALPLRVRNEFYFTQRAVVQTEFIMMAAVESDTVGLPGMLIQTHRMIHQMTYLAAFVAI